MIKDNKRTIKWILGTLLVVALIVGGYVSLANTTPKDDGLTVEDMNRNVEKGCVDLNEVNR